MYGTIFRYFGNHFILNFHKNAGIHYIWTTLIGDTEQAKDFTIKMTLGKGQPMNISQHGKVFPMDAKFEDIIKDDDGVLVFGKVGNRKDGFFNEANGRTFFSIFAELQGWPPVPSTSKGTDTNKGKERAALPNLSPDNIGVLRNAFSKESKDILKALLDYLDIKGDEGVNWLIDQRVRDPPNDDLYKKMIMLLLDTP